MGQEVASNERWTDLQIGQVDCLLADMVCIEGCYKVVDGNTHDSVSGRRRRGWKR